MLFNSYPFIFVFLPITVIVYFVLNRFRYGVAAKCWLALSSLFFYSWWNISYLPLLLGSIAFNYTIGRLLQARQTVSQNPSSTQRRRVSKIILFLGISGNVLLLIYYKYADFFLVNIGAATGWEVPLLNLVLPLGISFFTFTQIAYLVDAYRGKASEYNIINYVLFVTFYPHLIAGPILHHGEMMPQFDRVRGKLWDWGNAANGIYIFCIGLFKKVVIADTLAVYANAGFDTASGFVDSWIAALTYTFQLYFDFSGYTDMAIGAALLFNIRLPQNFNSPYKALNIQDFWRRWHMTLSRFLRDYIYIPLGGNRRGEAIMLRNLVLTFLIGGLWHGAGWTFLFWGLLHGVGQVIHRLWGKLGITMPRILAWAITFVFITVTWVFFRAETWAEAMRLLKGMSGLAGLHLYLNSALLEPLALIVVITPMVLLGRNSSELSVSFRPNFKQAITCAVLFVISLMYITRISEFLYFNF
ncbi:MBOAT family O-acyltransferase [Paenibacillus solani]|uniref:Acetyltransferase n=1 Tax=Paenibacillus solani TaxID=1705565 RepID=A0A0M1NJD4_9BACL|nr:MBOAT family protein [Paenibacillus solani]KOR82232.1 acetyltransferase [Paenibacillus solani]